MKSKNFNLNAGLFLTAMPWIIALVFTGLKLYGAITWGWDYVLFTVWAPLVLLACCVVIFMALWVIYAPERNHPRRRLLMLIGRRNAA